MIRLVLLLLALMATQAEHAYAGNWSHFTSRSCSFSIDYPSGWKVSGPVGISGVSSNPSVSACRSVFFLGTGRLRIGVIREPVVPQSADTNQALWLILDGLAQGLTHLRQSVITYINVDGDGAAATGEFEFKVLNFPLYTADLIVLRKSYAFVLQLQAPSTRSRQAWEAQLRVMLGSLKVH